MLIKKIRILTCTVLAVSLVACSSPKDAVLNRSSVSSQTAGPRSAECNSMSENSSGETASEWNEYEKYIYPFSYSIGRESWDSPLELEPDALVIFFFSLSLIGEVTIDEEVYPKDGEFGNPMIPSEFLESTVQKYLDVPADQIRRSTYYDSEQDAYWTGGIGSVIQLFFDDAEQDGSLLRINFTARIDASEARRQWKSRVTIQLKEDGGFRYLSYEREKEEQLE